MSMFDTVNKDALTGVEPTQGAARGFGEALSDAYDAAWRASSQFGLDTEMERANSEQGQRIFERTGKRDGHLQLVAPDGQSVARYGGVQGVAQFYENGGDADTARQLAAYDAHIEALRKAHPDLDLQTSRELWDGVKSKAVEAEHQADGRATLMGNVGHFIGEAAAGVDPRVNPLNTATLGVGGIGKSVAAKIATEAGGQSLIQGVNELTGVAENRRLLGLDTGIADSAGRVVRAGVAGGLIRGGIEGLGRLWRGKAPDVPANPEAPPQHPAVAAGLTPEPSSLFRDFEDFHSQVQQPELDRLIAEATQHTEGQSLNGRSRLGQARHEADLADVERQLQTIGRDGPVRIGDPGVAAFKQPTHIEIETPHWMKPADERVPEIARQADPELYANLDRIEARLADRREALKSLRGDRGPNVELEGALAKADELEEQVAKLREQMPGADRRKLKRLMTKVADIEDEQRRILQPHSEAGRGVVEADDKAAAISKEIMQLEDDRRSLSPLKNRAEDIAAQRYEDTRAKGDTFSAVAALLRKELRISDVPDAPLQQSRRPSEKLTTAEGGSNVAPGTVKRRGTTSGPNPEEKPGDGSTLTRFTHDVSHENANADDHILAAFDAANVLKRIKALDEDIAARKGTEADGKKIAELKAERDALANGEVILGGRRYKLDDEIATGELRLDDSGNVQGIKMMKVRDVLREFGDDADMMSAMKGCAL